MKITPPADDVGTESLKRTNVKKEVQETDHVEPYPPIAPTGRRGTKRRPVEYEQRREERRGKQRRQHKSDTLLDTRVPHERRTELRRKADRAEHQVEEEQGEGESPPEHGVDIEV